MIGMKFLQLQLKVFVNHTSGILISLKVLHVDCWLLSISKAESIHEFRHYSKLLAVIFS